MDGKYQFVCSRGIVEWSMMGDFLLHIENQAEKVSLASAIDTVYEHDTTHSSIVLRQENLKSLETLHSSDLEPKPDAFEAPPAYYIIRETRQKLSHANTLSLHVGSVDANIHSLLHSLHYRKVREMKEWAITGDMTGSVRMLIINVPTDKTHALVELRASVIEGNVTGAKQRLKYIELVYSPFVQILDEDD